MPFIVTVGGFVVIKADAAEALKSVRSFDEGLQVQLQDLSGGFSLVTISELERMAATHPIK